MRSLIAISLVILTVFSSCRAVRSASSSTHETTSDRTETEGHYERLYYVLRDSLANVKAPAERSESVGVQHSDLETSLARSTASVDSLGRLQHSIENKDSIPTRIVYRDIYHTRHDTMYVQHTDTVRIANTEYVEKEMSMIDKAQVGLARILLVAALLYFGIRFIKRKIKP